LTPSFRKKIQNERTFGSRFLKIFKIKQHANVGFWKIFKELWGFTTNETHAGVDIPFSKSLVLISPPYDTWWVSVIYPLGITREQKGGSKTLVWSLHWILHSIKPLALGYTRIKIMLGSHATPMVTPMASSFTPLFENRLQGVHIPVPCQVVS
jgi:hypothetical protein